MARPSRAPEVSVVSLEGPLYARQGAGLRSDVQALLHRGDRTIALCLARVSDIDAAGTGELVRAYNMTVAAAGALRITNVPARVREVLDRVGLFEILTEGE